MPPVTTVPYRGNQLREIRKAAGRTQRAVAEHLGITASAVGQWETGATRPAVAQVRRLDDFLEAEGEVLRLFGYESAHPAPAVSDPEVLRRLSVIESELGELKQLVSKNVAVLEYLGRAEASRSAVPAGAAPSVGPSAGR